MFCYVCLETLVGVYIDVSHKVRFDVYEEIVEVLHNCLFGPL